MQVRRFQRWLLPATGLSLGVAAISVLLCEEALQREIARPTRAGAAKQPPLQRAPSTTSTPPVASAFRAPLGDVDPVALIPEAGGGLAALRAAQSTQVGTGGELAALKAAPDLATRVAWIDGRTARLTRDEAGRLLSRLADSALPGDAYEATALRLAVIARLGSFPGVEADASIVRRLDPERPRPERMVALELLARRPDLAGDELRRLAQHDHDLVVRDKARWALAVRGGTG